MNTSKNSGPYPRGQMSLPPGDVITERLRLTPFTLEHEDRTWQLASDPRVLRYIGIPVETDRAAFAEQFQREISENLRYKFFYAAEFLEPASENQKGMVALVLARPTEDSQRVEVGYWVLPEFWGQGIATEMTFAALDVARRMEVRPEDIMAYVMVGNGASRRVLEKAGLYVEKNVVSREQDCWYLRLGPEDAPTYP